jgi:hypothetical protein
MKPWMLAAALILAIAFYRGKAPEKRSKCNDLVLKYDAQRSIIAP